MTLPEGWKQVPLDKVLSAEQLDELEKLLKTHPGIIGLKGFCKKHATTLDQHGILPDYLAYQLYYLTT